MAERAIALGEVDTFPFILARALGTTLAALDDMPYAEYVQWRAFYVWEGAMTEFNNRRARG